jgi:hypothetical protein
MLDLTIRLDQGLEALMKFDGRQFVVVPKDPERMINAEEMQYLAAVAFVLIGKKKELSHPSQSVDYNREVERGYALYKSYCDGIFDMLLNIARLYKPEVRN